MSINSSGEHSIRYLDVYNDLKGSILSGKFLRGSFLPTETGLTELYSVSRTTVRKAVSLLQAEGLVKVQQGRGTEVTGGKTQVRPTGLSEIYRNVTLVSPRYLVPGDAVCTSSVVDVVSADMKVANALEISVGTQVYRIQRLKIISGTTFGYIVSYIPTHLAPGLEEMTGQVFSFYQCMKDKYNISSVSLEEHISADTAKFLEANLLGVSVGSPILISYRTSWYEDGVMDYTETYHRSDIFQISVSTQGDACHAGSDSIHAG